MESAPTFLKRQSTSRHGTGSRFSCTVLTCGVCGRLSSSAKTPGAKLQQQSHAQHGCKYPLCFHLVLLIYRKQPGRSKPPGFKAMQFTFCLFAPQQHKQHGRAQRQHQQKRGPGGIAGLRNTECGCGGLRRGRGGRRFIGRRLRAYRRGNCAGLQRVNRPLSSSCGTKGESKGKGSEFFRWVISPILYNSLLNSLYRCVLLYIRHGHNIGPFMALRPAARPL